MKCPKCGSPMSIGTPHDESYIYQYECHCCGCIAPIVKDEEGNPKPLLKIGDGALSS